MNPSNMSRRHFLGVTAAAVPASGATRPNILVILADDMGYSDARCYGGDIDTPNIDSLAAGGLRFTQGYSTARCGPSRNCLTTGYYAQQTAADVMTPGRIPAWTRFVPHYLKEAGYRSYHSGKWHLRFRPLTGAGFDWSYLLQDQNRTFSPSLHYLNDEPLPSPRLSDGYYASTAIADHAVQCLKEHASQHADKPFFHYLAFTAPHFPLHAPQSDIREYEDRFSEGWDTARERRHARMRRMGLINCALPPLEPDQKPSWNLSEQELRDRIGPGEVARAVPWSTLTDEQKRFQRLKMAIHAAMITRMDKEIGRVLQQLKAMGAFDDTLILFVSDNGASAEQMIRSDGHDPDAAPGSAKSHLCLGPGWSSAANTPFRLHKSWVHEGGIASPWVMHWPKGISRKNQLVHTPCHFVDVLPTLIELSGGNPSAAHQNGAPALPGRSLLQAMKTGRSRERDHIYFHHLDNCAIRVGDMKGISGSPNGPWSLYNLGTDRSEMRDLAKTQPELAAKLGARWREVEDGYVKGRETAPAFPSDAPGLKPLAAR